MINLTGIHSTSEYELGRGIVYLAELDGTSLPLDFRDVGNSAAFNATIDTEKLEHRSSRQGLQVVDKEVVVSQKLTLAITMDSINFQNLAKFFSGTTTTFTNQTTIAAGVILLKTLNTSTFITASTIPFWFDLYKDRYNATPDLTRVYNIDTVATTAILNGENGVNVSADLIRGVDWTLDASFGRVFITASGITKLAATAGGGANEIVVKAATTFTAINTEPIHEVKILTSVATGVAVKFIASNPANSNAAQEAHFHKVTLASEGDLSLIGDEFTTIQLSGAAESVPVISTAFPFGYVRSYTGALAAA